MTDENREVSQDRDQAAVEQTGTPAPDGQIAEPDVPENDASASREEPLQDAGESTDADPEPVLQKSEPVGEGEATGDPAGMPAQGGADGEETSLTQREQEIDQAISTLLGESEETASEENSGQRSEDGGQTTEDTEQRAPDAESSSSVISPPSSELVPTVESVLEAILFATDEPLTDSKLAGIVETTAKQVRESIEQLNAKYAAENHAFRIEQIAGGYQMLTLNTYNPWLKKMLRVRSDNKLSPAAMETLAIIAYKQPIIRADIEAIRGVAVGDGLRNLMYKGLVKITGRAEILGRPILYGTTKKFLEVFGLNSLKDLPKAEELKNPDRG